MSTSIKTELYDHLRADAGVDAAVGARVYPNVAPKSADFPRITIQRISGDHRHHMTAAAGLCLVRFQIDCWGTTSVSVETVYEAVREALDGYSGSMGGVDVRDCFLDGDGDDYVAPTASDEVGVFRTRMEFNIWYAESVPTFS